MNRMLLNWERFLIVAAVIAAIPFSVPEARAVDRTVFFVATGTNRTTYGLSTTAGSTCRIILSNPSGQTQTFTIKPNVQSLDPTSASWQAIPATNPLTAGVNPNCSGTSGGATVSSCTSSSIVGSIPASGSVTIIFAFNGYQPRSAGATWQTASQTLRCSGSILAQDSSQPGYLLASGVLVTFTESAAMHTDATTGGTKTFGGMAVYSQVPIVINRSKPF